MAAMSLDHGDAVTEPAEAGNYRGLSQHEADLRLAAEGANELPSAQSRNVAAIALGVVRDPTFVLLFTAGTVYLVLGDLHEAMLLLSFVVMIMAITVYQEFKTERALDALRDLTSPRALVIRDGREIRIAGREVVRGDILLVTEGDRVPADAVLIAANDLLADESLLTGEPVPVRKVTWNGAQQIGRPGGDDLSFIYSGSVLTRGRGIAEVVATGLHTEIGRIGAALTGDAVETTPLQQQTARMVRHIAGVALVLAAILVVLYGLTRGGWLDAILAGVTLAMAILPQEFPVVLTVFLGLGAWRISRQRVLTRRIPVIETLGAATVLCVDKTGTLTLNRMTVRMLYAEGEFQEVAPEKIASLPEKFHELLEFGILASEVAPFDPMERAFHDLGGRTLGGTEHLHDDWSLVREYPISPSLLAHGHAWKAPDGDGYAVAVKGAPETVADLCRLSKEERRELVRRVSEMAAHGLRVLAVARARHGGTTWPDSLRDFDFDFLGLLGLADPIRPTVAAALAECYSAGMRVVMITGDYPVTAQAIADQIGLAGAASVVTGADIDGMTDVELRHSVRETTIFARVVPEQKLRLVNALKGNGEIVAMTGDGVNDAPALKAAHIGIAMGGRGTDVAREAASLVLLDDDFSSIVDAARLGRRIYDNIRNAMCYLIAVHVPIAGMSILPLLFGWPLVFYPAHIVFLEFVIDPACSIVFEAEEADPDIMKRPPHAPNESLFGGRTLILSLLQGLSVLAAVAVVFVLSLRAGSGEAEARAIAFAAVVISSVALIFANRSRTRSIFVTLRFPNRALWWVVAATGAGMLLTLYVPYLRGLFRLAPLHGADLLLCLGAAVTALLWFELYKLGVGRKLGKRMRAGA